MEKAVLSLFVLSMIACTKESPREDVLFDQVRSGRIVVNEVAATGSHEANEFGERADWIEVYNPGSDLLLKSGEWFVTDDPTGDPRKYELPEILIPEGGFVVIWCDEMAIDGVGIHTNFRLSPDDGSVAVVRSAATGAIIVDAVPVTGSPGPTTSFGRAPDGTDTWMPLSPPTPGSMNEPLGPLN